MKIIVVLMTIATAAQAREFGSLYNNNPGSLLLAPSQRQEAIRNKNDEDYARQLYETRQMQEQLELQRFEMDMELRRQQRINNYNQQQQDTWNR